MRARKPLPLSRYTPTANDGAAFDDAPPVTFTFFQREPAQTAPSFEIVDCSGRVVRRIAGTRDEDGVDLPNVTNLAGYNRVVWSLDEEPPTPWRRIAKWNQGPETGTPVLSGTYVVRLRRDGKTYEQQVRV